MTDKQPDAGQQLADAFAQVGRDLGKAFGNLAFVTAAQGAMGWMVQDEPEKARQALAKLTDEQCAKVAGAARKLAELADE